MNIRHAAARFFIAILIGLSSFSGSGVVVNLLSKTCAKVRSVLFLPRTVLLTVFVPGRRHFPACRRNHSGAVPGIAAWLATGSAVVAARAPVASRCRLTAALMSRS